MSRPWTLPEMVAQNRLGDRPVTVPLDAYLRVVAERDAAVRAVRLLSGWHADACAEITRLRAEQEPR